MSREQIDEMAKIICGMKDGCVACMFNKSTCYERKDAEDIYNAGYRKQIVGEWVQEKFKCKNGSVAYYAPKCSLCGHSDTDMSNYCPNCGAYMKGGNE